MNNKIKELKLDLKKHNIDRSIIESKIQDECDKIFNDSFKLAKVIDNAQSASEFQYNEHGEIESWFRFHELTEYSEFKIEFENWLQDNHCMGVDWVNDCLLYRQGESLIIHDDSRYKRDNGVWLNQKCVIEESEYRDESGEVDENKRNYLIEKYMEKTGYFPGVFRVDQHGNVFHVNTVNELKGTK